MIFDTQVASGCNYMKWGETMDQYIIETKQILKSYGSLVALNHVSIHISKGEIYGLIGDNGAGKTTLLKLLVGHIYPTSGDVELFGQCGERHLQHCRRKVGAMIEQPGFFSDLSVERNLEYYRIQKGVKDKHKTEEVLRLTGIWERRHSKGKNLSMGMKQRLGLAIAMIGNPEVLILDEPINGLDPSGIIEFRNLLHKLNKEHGITILLSSHILTELQQTATTFGFLNKGMLIREISRTQLEAEKDNSLEDYYMTLKEGGVSHD